MQRVECPKCKTDVMVTGWTEHAAVTRSWMGFNGSGAVVIATTHAAAEKVTCMLCGAELKKSPAEMLKAAA